MSNRRFALYATKRRMGHHSEHQIAGARLGQIGVGLRFTVLHGWTAEVFARRFSLKITAAPRKNDARVDDWFASVMERKEVG